MTIWKELYDIFDKERSRWQQSSANKQAIAFELKANLGFLADALSSGLSQNAIANGLEYSVFEAKLKEGTALTGLNRRKVTQQFIGEFTGFATYIGKENNYLVENAYSRIKSLKKLVAAQPDKNHNLRIKFLFNFLVFLVAHLEERPLSRTSARKSI
ncbi:hypothetical protein N5094_09315 [Shewanella putrefaciens]|uniref:hypothetical protein n=1 Tax=Shewanella putrefaciens TaxID=24 RepID=UPI0021C02BDE|nr:hypothetical protein [Shewanella putrefaciens]UXK10360.1 hypothetical protein N5094_09315 [Shewanella putrefaciens]